MHVPDLQPAVPDKWTLLEGLKIFFSTYFSSPACPCCLQPCPSVPLCLPQPFHCLSLSSHRQQEAKASFPALQAAQADTLCPAPSCCPPALPSSHPPWATLAQPEQSKALPSPTGLNVLPGLFWLTLIATPCEARAWNCFQPKVIAQHSAITPAQADPEAMPAGLPAQPCTLGISGVHSFHSNGTAVS